MSDRCRKPGCGRKLEMVCPYEGERFWLCPCCDRDGGPCEHVLEKRRLERLEELERRFRALPERDRGELYRRLGFVEKIRL